MTGPSEPTKPPYGPFYSCQKCHRSNPPDAIRWVLGLWTCASCATYCNWREGFHDLWRAAPILESWLNRE